MFRSYYQVRDWLESFIPHVWTKQELGLARIRHLLKLLGNPQDKFKSIHIAGTSGKGSTAFYIAKLLQQSGEGTTSGQSITSTTRSFLKARDTRGTHEAHGTLKIGLHLSPHLVDIRERMQIFRSEKLKVESGKLDEKLMPMSRFLRLFNEIKSVVEKIQREMPELTPSYFEILVAASFKYFADEKVDWAVVEVGMGGRLDATNVLQPQITPITNVGFDHRDVLGKTVEEIAYEKAGIIKEKVREVRKVREVSQVSDVGIPVVTAATGGALEVIKNVAKEKKAKLIMIDTQQESKSLKSDTKVNLIKYYDTLRHTPQNFVLENALLAATTLDILGIEVTESDLKKVLSLPFAGRFEQIDGGVMVDGAHNPGKIKVLIRWIKKRQLTTNKLPSVALQSRALAGRQLTTNQTPKKSDVSGQMSIVLVVAFKRGKDWKRMLDLLIKNLPVKAVIATQFYAVTDMGKYQAVEPQEIAEYIRTVYRLPTTVYSNSHEAVFEAVNQALITPGVGKVSSRHTPGVLPGLVLVTGSLYLVGEVRTMWHLPEF